MCVCIYRAHVVANNKQRKGVILTTSLHLSFIPSNLQPLNSYTYINVTFTATTTIGITAIAIVAVAHSRSGFAWQRNGHTSQFLLPLRCLQLFRVAIKCVCLCLPYSHASYTCLQEYLKVLMYVCVYVLIPRGKIYAI